MGLKKKNFILANKEELTPADAESDLSEKIFGVISTPRDLLLSKEELVDWRLLANCVSVAAASCRC